MPDSALESKAMRKIFGGTGSFLQTSFGIILATTIVWHVVYLAFKIPINYTVSAALLILDLSATFFLQDRLIYFFSQFVLPILNPKDRKEIHTRVRDFESGDRGPALFIKNGRVIEHPGETGRRGPGVIILDTASALVLRTDTEIRGVVGPGVKFTAPDEYIAGSVDLRAQWQFIGPLASDQPLLNPVPSPSQKNYSELQGRRQQTSGLTRDGFEVSPTISIKFSVKRSKRLSPDENGVISYYGFDPASVRNAITREVVRNSPSDYSKSRMEWNRLPAHLVVNLWREYVRKFKLEDLFAKEGIKSGLQTIQEMMNKRVRQNQVVALDDTGAPTGEALDSLEYLQLETHGLEVMEVRIHNVLFDPSIEEQMVQQWTTDWTRLAKKEESFLKEKEILIETASREEASKNFARIVSDKFGRDSAPPQNPYKLLQWLIHPLKEVLLKESNSNREMDAELRKMDEVWKWLLDQSTLPPQDGGGK